MKDAIAKTDANIQHFQTLGEHLKKLAKQPRKDQIKINKLANDAKYIDIATIEELLDYHFKGLWSTENFRWQIIQNEVIASIDLKVWHPEANGWLTRTGTAAWPIMVDRLTEEVKKDMTSQQRNLYATDPANKKPQALVTGFPRLKAECIKNAAKGLGQIFGRNLNRAHEDELGQVEQFDDLLKTIKECQTVDDLTLLKDSMAKIMLNDTQILDAMTAQYNEIRNQ